ncbi:MAG: cytochrome c3 family protein [Tepidisphaerales bacterium]
MIVFICDFCGTARAQLGDTPVDTGQNCSVCHLEWADSFKQPGGILLIDTPNKAVVADAETCLGCHDGSVADSRRTVWLQHGHRVGIVPAKGMVVPRELPLDNGKLACRTCHTAHVAGFKEPPKDAIFLRMRNNQDQLCKTCHADKTKGPEAGSHSLAEMKSAFPPVLAAAGAHAGPRQNQVLCQSCHIAHGGRDDKLLLMATSASELCITCHPTYRPAMWDTDPAHNHPQNPPIKDASQLKAIKDMGTLLGADNRLVCLSCHKMHDGHSGKAIVADTLVDSGMCIRCHEDHKPMLGSGHDLRKSAPGDLNVRSETAAQSGPCAACHTFHSYTRKPTPEARDPQGLCTTCHADGQVAAKHAGKLFHPIDLSSDRIPGGNTLTLAISTKDPARKTLACMACHDPHDTKRPHFLRVSSDQICVTCHADLAQSLSKPHDFTGKNDLKNALGASPAESGRCGFCHSMHQARGPMMLALANLPFKTMDDACLQCHQPQGMAHKKSLGKFNHPSGPEIRLKESVASLGVPLFNAKFEKDPAGAVACSSCHNVHIGEKQSKWLLRSTSPTQLCVECHSPEGKMAGGAHDPKTCKKPFPAAAAKSNDLCLACHRAHGNELQKQLWTMATAAGQVGSDGACVACHANQAWSTAARADRNGPMLHPQPIRATSSIAKLQHGLPLAKPSSADAVGSLVCKTCHDPHAAPRSASLLRLAADRTATEICGKCHDEARHIETSAHSRDELAKQISEQHSCAPCHRVHAGEGMSREHLWSTHVFAKGVNSSEQLCLGCHSAAGGARVPAVYSHPETNIKDIRKATTRPSALIDQFGRISQITCATCHLTHGRELATAGAGVSLDRAEITGAKTVLRPNVDRQICAPCHGGDAGRMYLYFHNPEKRAAVKELDEAP